MQVVPLLTLEGTSDKLILDPAIDFTRKLSKIAILTRIPCNDGWGCIQTLAVGQVGGSSPDLVSRRTLGLAAGRYNGQVGLSVAVKALGRARNTFVVFF